MTRKTRKTEAPMNDVELASDAAIVAYDELHADDAINAINDDAEHVEVATRSVVPKRWRDQYNHNPLKGTCNDELAKDLKSALANVSLVELGELNGIDVAARWGARNVGMQRMNLGNVLRSRAKRGEAVHLS